MKKVKLGDVFKLSSGKSLPEKKRIAGDCNVYGGNGITGIHNDYFVEERTVVIGRVGEYCGATHLTSDRCWVTDNALMVTEWYEEVNQEFMVYLLNSLDLNRYAKTVGQPSISQTTIYEIEVMIPEISYQIEVVNKLNKIKKIINDKSHQIVFCDELIKSKFIEMFGDITEEVPLSYYISSLTAGKSLAGMEESENKVLKTGAISYDYFDETQVKNLPNDYEPDEKHMVCLGDVLISRMNTVELVGAAAYVWNAPENIYLPDRLWRAEIKNTIYPIFLWQLLIQPSTKNEIRKIASGTSGSMKNISKPNLLRIKVKKVDYTLQEEYIKLVEVIDKLKFDVQKSLDETQVLFDSLMQSYFG